MKELKMLTEVPQKLVIEKEMNVEAKKMGLHFYCDYLQGAKGYVDEDEGTQIDFKFDHYKKRFKMPLIAFMLYEQNQLDLDELLIFSYLCYLSNIQKNHLIKVNFEKASKSLGYSKTKIKTYISRISEYEIELIKLTDRQNEFEISMMNEEEVNKLDQMFSDIEEKHRKIESGEIESDYTNIPQYFAANFLKLGFKFEEQMALLTFAMWEQDNITFEEAVAKIVEKTKLELTEFDILRIVNKAKKENILRIIKAKEKYHVEWLSGAFGE